MSAPSTTTRGSRRATPVGTPAPSSGTSQRNTTRLRGADTPRALTVLGAVDAVRAAQIETANAFNFTPYVVAGLLFVLLALPTIRLTDWYTARLRSREQIGSIV